MISGLLTRADILALNIIQLDDPLQADERCYDLASYDFRLGDEYIFPEIKNGKIVTNKCSDSSGILIIEPYSCVIVSTFENVKLPANIAGRFDLRISWVLAGLMLQVGTQIEPGYWGKLWGILYNMTNKRIMIKQGEKLLTVEFFTTTRPTDIDVSQVEKVTDIKKFLTHELMTGTLNLLLEDARKVERSIFKRFGILQVLLIAVVTLVLSIVLPLVITKFTYDKDDFPMVTQTAIELLKEDLYITTKDKIYNDLKLHLQHQLDSLKNKQVSPKIIRQFQNEINIINQKLSEENK